MYADRIASGSKRSVKDRLNGNSEGDFDRIKQINGKRQRQTDSWKHDLYNDEDEPQLSNPNVGAQDLRLKLQRKGVVQQSGKGGPGDLRAKLSGMMHAQPGNIVVTKAKPVLEVVKSARKNLPVVATPIEIEKVAISVPKMKKSLQKDDTSVGGLLRSLGLEKYLITFQAEEIDTTALMHMTDKDLKTLGIPMGPRKKILLALDSQA